MTSTTGPRRADRATEGHRLEQPVARVARITSHARVRGELRQQTRGLGGHQSEIGSSQVACWRRASVNGA